MLLPFSSIALATIFAENPIPIKWSTILEFDGPADELALVRGKNELELVMEQNPKHSSKLDIVKILLSQVF